MKGGSNARGTPVLPIPGLEAGVLCLCNVRTIAPLLAPGNRSVGWDGAGTKTDWPALPDAMSISKKKTRHLKHAWLVRRGGRNPYTTNFPGHSAPKENRLAEEKRHFCYAGTKLRPRKASNGAAAKRLASGVLSFLKKKLEERENLQGPARTGSKDCADKIPKPVLGPW